MAISDTCAFRPEQRTALQVLTDECWLIRRRILYETQESVERSRLLQVPPESNGGGQIALAQFPPFHSGNTTKEYAQKQKG